MDYVASFFAGVFLRDCIPHLGSGLRGESFPTPFAKPHGKGQSSLLVNFRWGAFNLLVGVVLLSSRAVIVDLDPGIIALVAGALAAGIYLSLHFGKVPRDRSGSW